MQERSDTGGRSVQAALDVLEAVALAEGEVDVTGLAQRVGLTKGSIFRHLQTLVERGYLAQNLTTSRYQLGVKLHLLGQVASGRIDLLSAAEEPLKALREELGQTVVRATVGLKSVVALSTLLAKAPIQIGVRPGTELGFHASAQGKVALAFGRRTVVAQTKRQPLARFTERTITDPAALEREIEKVRRRGWATAPEEFVIGINALAALVFGETGDCVGTVAVVGSIQFIPRAPDASQVDAVTRTADWISRNLGFGGTAGTASHAIISHAIT
jgi:DNA-binding IclR family transcriptional regulator